MTVVLDRAANVTVSRQSENATKKQQHVSESSNVRSGLFGTALAEDPDTSHRKVNVKFIDKPSKGKAGNNVHRKIEVSNNSNSAHKKKNGNKKGRESVTDQDLDQDLDTYMSSR